MFSPQPAELGVGAGLGGLPRISWDRDLRIFGISEFPWLWRVSASLPSQLRPISGAVSQPPALAATRADELEVDLAASTTSQRLVEGRCGAPRNLDVILGVSAATQAPIARLGYLLVVAKEEDRLDRLWSHYAPPTMMTSGLWGGSMSRRFCAATERRVVRPTSSACEDSPRTSCVSRLERTQ